MHAEIYFRVNRDTKTVYSQLEIEKFDLNDIGISFIHIMISQIGTKFCCDGIRLNGTY